MFAASSKLGSRKEGLALRRFALGCEAERDQVPDRFRSRWQAGTLAAPLINGAQLIWRQDDRRPHGLELAGREGFAAQRGLTARWNHTV